MRFHEQMCKERSRSLELTIIARESALARPVDDAAFGEIVRRELDGHGVAFQDADVVFTHLARDVCGHHVAVLELDAKGRVR